MKDHVFIDTDVLLDVLAARQEFLIGSSKIISLCEEKKIIGYTSAICIVNCIYLLERLKIQDIKASISSLSKIVTILPCTSKDIDDSINSKFKDIEDGIQNAIAENSGKCKTIITRNFKDYASSKLEIFTPNQYLKKIQE
jgi:predicted nucleic acid-binding protein